MVLTYRPTISSSFSAALGLILVQISIANRVLAELKMDVRELMMADSITAISKPRRPGE